LSAVTVLPQNWQSIFFIRKSGPDIFYGRGTYKFFDYFC
jgi:hypothetical protein